MDIIISSLGKAIKVRRVELDLTLKQLSELSSISEGYLCQIEKSRRGMSINILISIASCLQILPSKLLQNAEYYAEQTVQNKN